MKKMLSLFTAVLTLSACSTVNRDYTNTLNSFLGQPKEDLLLDLGIPNRKYKSDKNTEFFTYRRSEKIKINEGDYRKTEYYCITTFIIKDDIVSDWSYKGNDCGKGYRLIYNEQYDSSRGLIMH